MTKLTAIVPTFNEQDNIQRALNSVSFADEIIVIDSFSTDKTVDIVKKSKAKLIQRKFDNFSAQKNYAIKKANYRWIFLLDADEEITEQLKDEIIEKINLKPEFDAFYVKRNFFMKKKEVKYSGIQNDKVIRLFKKNSGFFKRKVHEFYFTTQKVGYLENKLNHFSYKSYQQYKKKLHHYAKLQALELFEKGVRANLLHFLFKPITRLFIQFFIKLGFLDGFKGLKMSLLQSYGVLIRYVELLKLQNNPHPINLFDEQNNLKIGYEAKRIFHNTTGLGNYGRDLVQILSKFYPDNQYYLYNPKPKKVNRLQLSENMIEILPEAFLWKKLSSVWRQKPVSKQIIEDQINIFHGLSGEIPRGLDKTNIKTVVTIHDLIFERYPELYSYIDRKIHFKKFQYACKKANTVIAISEQTKKDIIRFLKIDASKIEVVYQGCHQVFKEQIKQPFINSVLKKYNLPTDFIINVGTIQQRKNALTIVKAVKNINTNLVIVGGKTKYYEVIKNYIDQHKLGNKIFFLEGLTLKEIASLYRQAKISVYPSIFEGFGIPIIESMFCKTPVITSSGGVFPEAGGNHSVYLKNPLDEKEMKIAIEDLLSSEEKRTKIAKKGFEFVQKFNDEVIAKNIMNVYLKVLKA